MAGTIKDYADIVSLFNNGKITYEEYVELFGMRSGELEENNDKPIDKINKDIIGNTK